MTRKMGGVPQEPFGGSAPVQKVEDVGLARVGATVRTSDTVGPFSPVLSTLANSALQGLCQ